MLHLRSLTPSNTRWPTGDALLRERSRALPSTVVRAVDQSAAAAALRTTTPLPHRRTLHILNDDFEFAVVDDAPHDRDSTKVLLGYLRRPPQPDDGEDDRGGDTAAGDAGNFIVDDGASGRLHFRAANRFRVSLESCLPVATDQAILTCRASARSGSDGSTIVMWSPQQRNSVVVFLKRIAEPLVVKGVRVTALQGRSASAAAAQASGNGDVLMSCVDADDAVALSVKRQWLIEAATPGLSSSSSSSVAASPSSAVLGTHLLGCPTRNKPTGVVRHVQRIGANTVFLADNAGLLMVYDLRKTSSGPIVAVAPLERGFFTSFDISPSSTMMGALTSSWHTVLFSLMDLMAAPNTLHAMFGTQIDAAGGVRPHHTVRRAQSKEPVCTFVDEGRWLFSNVSPESESECTWRRSNAVEEPSSPGEKPVFVKPSALPNNSCIDAVAERRGFLLVSADRKSVV